MKDTVKAGDTITLHFKISALDGTVIDNTFDGEPVTLTLGSDEIAATLEQWLIGIPCGERYVFQLEPWQAFGASDPELVQSIPLADFPEGLGAKEGSLVEFTLPNGTTLAGLVKSRTQTDILVDFNHPLSDCPILFEVEVKEIVH
jgi:FKBP-type peptidyl-prolyl cis-trans isomerase SlpA